MSMTVKKGDNVLVVTGKDKGKTGKVTEVSPKSNKVLVDGVNIVTKHQKARKQDEKSQIVKKNAPIEASNVMVVCPSCGKPSRVGHKEIDGKKVRICKKCGTSLDKEFVKASKKEAKKATEAKATVKEEVKTEAKATKTTKTVEKKTTSSTKTAEKATSTAKTAPKKSTAKKSEA